MLAKTETLEQWNLTQWQISVLMQGLALVVEKRIYDQPRTQEILKLARRIKNIKPTD